MESRLESLLDQFKQKAENGIFDQEIVDQLHNVFHHFDFDGEIEKIKEKLSGSADNAEGMDARQVQIDALVSKVRKAADKGIIDEESIGLLQNQFHCYEYDSEFVEIRADLAVIAVDANEYDEEDVLSSRDVQIEALMGKIRGAAEDGELDEESIGLLHNKFHAYEFDGEIAGIKAELAGETDEDEAPVSAQEMLTGNLLSKIRAAAENGEWDQDCVDRLHNVHHCFAFDGELDEIKRGVNKA